MSDLPNALLVIGHRTIGTIKAPSRLNWQIAELTDRVLHSCPSITFYESLSYASKKKSGPVRAGQYLTHVRGEKGAPMNKHLACQLSRIQRKSSGRSFSTGNFLSGWFLYFL